VWYCTATSSHFVYYDYYGYDYYGYDYYGYDYYNTWTIRVLPVGYP
jgi:hypothetical protein